MKSRMLSCGDANTSGVEYDVEPMMIALKALFGAPRALLFLCIAVLVCPACVRGPTELRFIDLVADRHLVVADEALRPAEEFAADETWLAVEVPTGRRVTSDLVLGDEPIMALRGCVQCQGTAPGAFTGSLLGDVSSSGGDHVEFEITLDEGDGWWHDEVDLGSVPRRSARLSFQVELPEGCSLLLRQATVRHRVAAPRATEEPPVQILLISVDTLRSDVLGDFGSGDETPNLDHFATESERFPHHYAAASWTKPSHASMLTGYSVETHRAIQLNQAMDPAIPTLAERFSAGGFVTSALVYDCGWLSRRWGFGKGFDSYRLTRWRAGRQAVGASEWILDHRDQPFFLFVHTFEPHSDFEVLPYEAPGVSRRSIAEEFGVTGFGRRQGFAASRFMIALDRGEIPRHARDAEIMRSTYEAGVRYLDDAMGVLFEALEESGVWDQLLVVVTSDHGEEFDEHGGFGHGSMYEEIIAVPLLVKWPQSEHAGEVNNVLSSSVDLAPTLLDYAGLPTDDLPGSNLRALTGDEPVYSGTLEWAVISGDLKGIFGPGGPRMLFDLSTDPEERRNLLDEDPRRAAALEELVREHRRQALELYRRIGSRSESGAVELSAEERERLEAFGYFTDE